YARVARLPVVLGRVVAGRAERDADAHVVRPGRGAVEADDQRVTVVEARGGVAQRAGRHVDVARDPRVAVDAGAHGRGAVAAADAAPARASARSALARSALARLRGAALAGATHAPAAVTAARRAAAAGAGRGVGLAVGTLGPLGAAPELAVADAFLVVDVARAAGHVGRARGE